MMLSTNLKAKVSLFILAMALWQGETSFASAFLPKPTPWASLQNTVSTTTNLPSSTSSGNTVPTGSSSVIEEYSTYSLDYHAANEFIEAHYPQLFQGQDSDKTVNNGPHYFHADGVQEEQVWNARQGVLDNDHYDKDPTKKHAASLAQNGFTLVESPTTVKDFTDLDQVKERYLPELLNLLKEQNITPDTHHILFWNPVMRGTDLESKERELVPTEDGSDDMIIGQVAMSTTAGMVHIDTDVGAHPEPSGFLNVMYKNRVIPSLAKDNQSNYHLPTLEELEGKIEDGNRFGVFNFWRNANPDNPVIQRAPLGLYLPYYDNDKDARFGCFPGGRPHPTKSRWYHFPQMAYDECLIFRQYDRDASQISDIWHTALKKANNNNSGDSSPRLSFDIRALVVAKDEVVPPKRDRYGAERIQPDLDFESSRDEFAQQQDERQTKREQEQNMS